MIVLPRSLVLVWSDFAVEPLRSTNSINTKPMIANVASVVGVNAIGRNASYDACRDMHHFFKSDDPG